MVARFHLILFVALSALGSALGGAEVHAASFQISPLLIELPPQSNIATYTLHNSGETQLDVQVSAYRWEQEPERDRLTPAENLMIVPAIVSIPPGRDQLVRVALRSQRPANELSYRLHFQELPAQTAEGAVVVQTLLKINVPLFFAPKHISTVYEPRLLSGSKASEVVAEITNTGSRYLRLSRLVLLNANGEQISEVDGPLYVLPGATRQWTFESSSIRKNKGKSNTYQLQVVSGRESNQHLLEIH